MHCRYRRRPNPTVPSYWTRCDTSGKRRFLVDKGPTDGEIQLLLHEMVRRVPHPPPWPFLSSCLFASPRSSHLYHLACTHHRLRPACPVYLRAPSNCFRGLQGAPPPSFSSSTCVFAFLIPSPHSLLILMSSLMGKMTLRRLSNELRTFYIAQLASTLATCSHQKSPEFAELISLRWQVIDALSVILPVHPSVAILRAPVAHSDVCSFSSKWPHPTHKCGGHAKFYYRHTSRLIHQRWVARRTLGVFALDHVTP